MSIDKKINYEEAKSLASNIKTSSNNIKSLLDDSDSSVKRIQSNWEGNSADVAIGDWNTWKKDFEEYYQMLLQNVSNIENACTEFLEAESRIEKSFE